MAHISAKARTGWVNGDTQDPDDLDRILGDLRALWEAAGADPVRRSVLQAKIVQAVEKLKKQVGAQLTTRPRGRPAYPLFGGGTPDEAKALSGPSPS